MLQDLLKARGLLLLLVKRELRSRYAASNFGAFWNLVHPIVMVVIYFAIFGELMASRGGGGGSETDRYDYLIHLTAGMVPWLMFSEIISRCCTVLLENANILKKMALPEEVLFLSVFVTSFSVYSISLVALVAILWMAGAPVTFAMVFAFPVMVALGLSALGLGMILSVMNLMVRDVAQFVDIGLKLGFWSLPIVYLPTVLPRHVAEIIALNPIYGFHARIQSLFGSPWVEYNPDSYWLMVLLPFAMLLFGVNFLRSQRSEILDAL